MSDSQVVSGGEDTHRFWGFTAVIYEKGDPLSLFLGVVSLIPLIFVIVIFVIGFLKPTHRMGVLLTGMAINFAVSVYLKQNVFQQARPDHPWPLAGRSDYGMPSNHSQFMSYLTMAAVLSAIDVARDTRWLRGLQAALQRMARLEEEAMAAMVDSPTSPCEPSADTASPSLPPPPPPPPSGGELTEEEIAKAVAFTTAVAEGGGEKGVMTLGHGGTTSMADAIFGFDTAVASSKVKFTKMSESERKKNENKKNKRGGNGKKDTNGFDPSRRARYASQRLFKARSASELMHPHHGLRCLGMLGLTLLVMYSRVYNSFHTTEQVWVGFACGWAVAYVLYRVTPMYLALEVVSEATFYPLLKLGHKLLVAATTEEERRMDAEREALIAQAEEEKRKFFEARKNQ